MVSPSLARAVSLLLSEIMVTIVRVGGVKSIVTVDVSVTDDTVLPMFPEESW